MQDEYGRPLSDDGQWVWDGSVWQPTHPPDPATVGYAPTQVDRPAPYGAGYYGSVGQPGGFGQPGQPGGPRGPGQPPTPWYKRPGIMAAIIGALLIAVAVLVTVLLVTGGDDKSGTKPTPTPTPTTAPPTTTPPTSAPPSPTMTPTPTPTPTPTQTPTQTPNVPATVASGVYSCTAGGTPFGTVTFAGNEYVTNHSGDGTYDYDPTTGRISFTGADLGPYRGTYDPNGPSMRLTASGNEIICSQ